MAPCTGLGASSRHRHTYLGRGSDRFMALLRLARIGGGNSGFGDSACMRHDRLWFGKRPVPRHRKRPEPRMR